MFRENLRRRDFLRLFGLTATGVVAAACQPKVIEVERVIKETVVVTEEKVVKEAVEVEKEVTRVVEKAVEQPPAAKEPVSLRIHRNSYGDWVTLVHDRFREENPHITLAEEPSPGAEYWAILRTLYAGGRLGDTFWTWQENGDFDEYANAGMVASIQDYVDAEGYDTGVFFSSCINLFYVEGKLMLLPEYGHPGPTGIYFNKRMCDEAGITYVPETDAREADIYDDWTLDEFLDVVLRLTKRDTDGRVTQWGYSRATGYHQQVSMMRRFGGDVLAEDARTVTVDSEESIAGIQFVADLFHEHKIWPTPDAMEDSGLNMFIADQRMATYCHGIASATQLRHLLQDKFDHGSTLIPRHPELDHRGLLLSTGGNCVSSLSKNPDAAWEYCKFMASHFVGTTRTLVGGAGPGARPDCWYDERVQAYDRVIPKFAELIPDARPHIIPWNARAAEFQDAVNQNIQLIWLGRVSAPEGCRIAAEAARKVIAEERL